MKKLQEELVSWSLTFLFSTNMAKERSGVESYSHFSIFQDGGCPPYWIFNRVKF